MVLQALRRWWEADLWQRDDGRRETPETGHQRMIEQAQSMGADAPSWRRALTAAQLRGPGRRPEVMAYIAVRFV